MLDRRLLVGIFIFTWTLVFGVLSGAVLTLYVSYVWNIFRTWRDGGEMANAVYPFRLLRLLIGK